MTRSFFLCFASLTPRQKQGEKKPAYVSYERQRRDKCGGQLVCGAAMSPLSTAEITCLELNNSQVEQHGPVGYKNVQVADEKTNSWREPTHFFT